MSLQYNFTGKTVLLTGGSMGIGLELVECLAESGARVISLSRTTDDLEKLKQEKPHYSIEAIKCDISNWAELEQVGKSLPVVDFLVNNAGRWDSMMFGEITSDYIDLLFDLNVKAVINLSQVVTNVWKEHKIKGVIVNVSSQGSKMTLPTLSPYCATKAALDSITRSMALELGPYGIRVNSVNPTIILTERVRKNWNDSEECKAHLSRIPLGRAGEVHEVVDIIMYLLSDGCTLVTGTTVVADGGYTAC